MLTKILDTIKQNNLLSPGDRVLCALSGGMDSSVMLDILVALSEKLGITVAAAHLNHMLRGEDSFADEEFSKKKCLEYGIDFISERADVKAHAEKSGESTELAARNVRYDFLARAKKELSATKIATAHNANDNLETILLNLARGSGIDGVCGIPPMRGDIVRPILCLSRDEIEAYAKENNISYCTDKTNESTDYSRNMLRHNAVPALLKVNSAAVHNAYRTSSNIRKSAQFIRERTQKRFEEIFEEENACKCALLLSTDPALFAGVCNLFSQKALGDDTYTLSSKHVEDVLTLAKEGSPSGEISLPKGLRVHREYENIVFLKEVDNEIIPPATLTIGENFWGGYKINVKKTEDEEKINSSLNIFRVPCDTIESTLTVRARTTGDEIKLKSRPRKTLKKLFIDAKIPKNERDTIPVILDGEDVLFVYGFGADEKTLYRAGEEILEIEIERI